MIFRSSASSREAFAWPSAKKDCWKPVCAPKAKQPNRKILAAQTAVSIRLASLVKILTNTWGTNMMASQNTVL